jgi:hypothetical protein
MRMAGFVEAACAIVVLLHASNDGNQLSQLKSLMPTPSQQKKAYACGLSQVVSWLNPPSIFLAEHWALFGRLMHSRVTTVGGAA